MRDAKHLWAMPMLDVALLSAGTVATRESHTYVHFAIVVSRACLPACLRSLFFYEGPNFAVVGGVGVVGGDVRCVDRVVTDGEHFAQMTGGRRGRGGGRGKGKRRRWTIARAWRSDCERWEKCVLCKYAQKHSSPTRCLLLLPFLHPDSFVDDMQLFASLRLDRSEVDFGIKYSIRHLETPNSPESAVRCATVVVPANGRYP